MLVYHATIANERIYVCDFRLIPYDPEEAMYKDWYFCPHCGHHLWKE